MKDRADYARKGIARGRSVVVLSYDGGIAFVAENPSRALHKVSEIYDRIAFAAVGKYNEFENLRVAGVRLRRPARLLLRPARRHRPRPGQRLRADPRQRLHHRAEAARGRDRRGRGRRRPGRDQIYRLTYDGSVADEPGYVAMGGQAEQIPTGLQERCRPGLTLSEALGLAVELLARDAGRRPRRASSAPRSSRSPCSTGCGRGARSAGSPGRCSSGCCAPDDPTTDVPHTDDAAAGPARDAHRRRERAERPTPTRGANHAPDDAARRRADHGERASTTHRHEQAPRTVPLSVGPHRVGAMDRRIFGIETEFGVTCAFEGQRKLSPDEVARYLFRKVVSWGRSSNVFLRNGARLYLDVGSHPEYATPECDDVRQLVVHDRAGERILEGLHGRRRAPAARGGHRRRGLPLQEQHRLGGQLLRLPRELPGQPARRVRPAVRRPDPVPGHPPADLRRGQGAADPARRRLLPLASAPTTSGRASPAPPPGRGRSSTPGTSRTRTPRSTAACTSSSATRTWPSPRRCSRSAAPTCAADDRGGRRPARPHAGEPDPGDPRGQPRPDRPAPGAAGQRPRGQRARDPEEYLERAKDFVDAHGLHTDVDQAGARPLGAGAAGRSAPATSAWSTARSTG